MTSTDSTPNIVVVVQVNRAPVSGPDKANHCNPGDASYEEGAKRQRTVSGSVNTNPKLISAHGIVRFNVGGRWFEIPRSTIERYPNTMLSRMINKVWEHEDFDPINDAFYIDRNGDRLQYVLDWMRDGEVHVPVTESYTAIYKELDFFGFDQIKPESIVQGTIEGGRVLTAISTNVHEELDSLDDEIQRLQAQVETAKRKKNALRAAHCLFMRSAIAFQEGNDEAEVVVQDTVDKTNIYNAYNNEESKAFLLAQMKEYGLVVSVDGEQNFGESQSTPSFFGSTSTTPSLFGSTSTAPSKFGSTSRTKNFFGPSSNPLSYPTPNTPYKFFLKRIGAN